MPSKTIVGRLNYDPASGSYKGVINLGNSFSSGNYNFNVVSQGYLVGAIDEAVNVTRSSTAKPPPLFLVTGDTDTNNSLNILDYNNILSCFGVKRNSASCAFKDTTDLDDNGNIDGIDYNLLLREIRGT